jgi:hypothetical protein
VELLIARNPDPDSRLPYLLRLPIGDGLVFRTKGTWPRTSALYCHPVAATEWPEHPELVEQVPLRAPGLNGWYCAQALLTHPAMRGPFCSGRSSASMIRPRGEFFHDDD